MCLMFNVEETDPDEQGGPRLKGVPCSPVTHSLLPVHIVSSPSRQPITFLSTHRIFSCPSFVHVNEAFFEVSGLEMGPTGTM